MKKKLNRKKAKRRTQKQHTPPNYCNLVFVEYEITDEPIHIMRHPINAEQITELYNMVYLKPKEAISQLKHLIEKYPNYPLLYNYLVNAYQNTSQFKEMEAVAKENYERHPDYLFAKLDYGAICLEKGNIDAIPEIFDRKYDLQMVYPNRTRFHVTEYVGFAAPMARYFLKINEIKTAKVYYYDLKNIAPKHPATKNIKKRLYLSLISRMFKLTRRHHT